MKTYELLYFDNSYTFIGFSKITSDLVLEDLTEHLKDLSFARKLPDTDLNIADEGFIVFTNLEDLNETGMAA